MLFYHVYHRQFHLTFFLFFFFLMIRRPPRSTLFPTRRSSDLGRENGQNEPGTQSKNRDFYFERSEEHTSELQSQPNLVCRLLLEKKKKKKKRSTNSQKKRQPCGQQTKYRD